MLLRALISVAHRSMIQGHTAVGRTWLRLGVRTGTRARTRAGTWIRWCRVWHHFSLDLVHLEDEISTLDVRVLLDEERAVVIEAPVLTHTPNVLVKRVEVVTEPQVEGVRVRVPIVRLDVVVTCVPGHGTVVATLTPVIPHGRPEVHVEEGPLVHVPHRISVCSAADLSTVDRPGDVVGLPDDLIFVPVGRRVEVLVVLTVHRSVPPDDIREEGVLLLRGYELDIDLFPLCDTPGQSGFAIPEGEEGGDGAFLARPLQPRPELAIAEGLARPDLPTEVVSRINTPKCHQGSCYHRVTKEPEHFYFEFFELIKVTDWRNLYFLTSYLSEIIRILFGS